MNEREEVNFTIEAKEEICYKKLIKKMKRKRRKLTKKKPKNIDFYFLKF